MAYEIKTLHGYDFYEVASAFQKAIRRGIEDDAVFFAIELFESNYEKYLWSRLYVIASEDIGLGDPMFLVKLNALKTSYDYLEKARPNRISKRLPLLQAIVMAVHSPKSRYIDLSYSVQWATHNETAKTKQIPDYAYDMHTKKGKIKGRGLEHFYSEGALINNANKFPREEQFEEMAMRIDMGEKQPKIHDELDPDPNIDSKNQIGLF